MILAVLLEIIIESLNRKSFFAWVGYLFDRGVTVLFVSHSLEQVQRICDKAIILDSGRLVANGPVEKVARIYKNMTE